MVSIVGPNGSGKSTLLKSIVGVVEVLGGQVLIGERDVTGWQPENVARIGVGYVPQVDDVFGPLTVKENLEMGGYLLRAREVPARVEHVLRCPDGGAQDGWPWAEPCDPGHAGPTASQSMDRIFAAEQLGDPGPGVL